MMLLSHPISSNTPMYGNSHAPQFRKIKSIEMGDNCNTMEMTVLNHSGTHLDCPAHFDGGGASVTDLPLDFWFSKKVSVLVLKEEISNSHVINVETIKNCLALQKKDDQEIEVVLLITKHGASRGNDDYWKSSPIFYPGIAAYIRKRFPQVKFFGFDAISLSNISKREIGKKAHQAFLKHERPIILIEDMNLENLADCPLTNLLISPLFVEKADGVPCTVWGNIT